ncbi:hypothetical protein DMW62_04190 [Serratia marcescens]|uniref:Immunity protein n=1 Tax=Serratia marcescens TaxID=615 RepID=A0ABX5NJ57_SERMA|nr:MULTISPECIES: hypothetical protein [Enterobacterales]MBX9285120.1 hypothetical protein [Serratia marcescens]MBX9293480.1 hypothetical protein [Serratia marcescens]MBX9302500.1 hypothetical protein [Serratia marcescens]MBX9308692.1 hypothetical protein [Serratia marcescens]MBX9309781.1 hypothetical protein [Serratia marcescens]
MLISKKSLLVLLYLCVAFFLMIFFVSFIFQVVGYWIGGGDQMLGYLKENFHKVLNTALVGVGVGFTYWLFYYRKI